MSRSYLTLCSRILPAGPGCLGDFRWWGRRCTIQRRAWGFQPVFSRSTWRFEVDAKDTHLNIFQTVPLNIRCIGCLHNRNNMISPDRINLLVDVSFASIYIYIYIYICISSTNLYISISIYIYLSKSYLYLHMYICLEPRYLPCVYNSVLQISYNSEYLSFILGRWYPLASN